ncbi:thromboxane-A synthase [Pitangus sulphuratus]|nr:thromboxane-A synthase [Pitangus sulphuratus]
MEFGLNRLWNAEDNWDVGVQDWSGHCLQCISQSCASSELAILNPGFLQAALLALAGTPKIHRLILLLEEWKQRIMTRQIVKEKRVPVTVPLMASLANLSFLESGCRLLAGICVIIARKPNEWVAHCFPLTKPCFHLLKIRDHQSLTIKCDKELDKLGERKRKAKYERERYYIGRQMFVVVSSPDMIKQILVTDFSNFTNRTKPNLISKPMLDSILCLRDDRWKYVRSLLTPAFSDTKLKEMTPLINQACDILLCNLKVYADSGKAFDIQRCYNCFTLDVVGSVAFGTEVDSEKNPDDPFVKNCRTFFEMSLFKPLLILILSFPFIMIPLLRIFPNKKQKELNGFFIQTIKNAIVYRHQQDAAERRRDFLQWMLDSRDSADSLAAGCSDVISPSAASRQNEAPLPGRAPSEKVQKTLTEDEIAGQAFLFLIAGYETTTSTLSFATYLLATNPECQEKVLQEIDEFSAKHVSMMCYEYGVELPAGIKAV